jgi:hypothetical protein
MKYLKLYFALITVYLGIVVPETEAKRWASISSLWPDAVVPYKISKSVQFTDSKGEVQGAMEEIQNNTCIRFVPRSKERDFVQISAGLGCNSNVGKSGSEQMLLLEIPSCLERKKLLRQFLHLLGLPSEHLRPDRDEHVKINWDNISILSAPLFAKLNSTDLPLDELPYDYNSVLHADPFFHSMNSSIPTILPLEQGATIGKVNGLSSLDIMKLNLLYC